MAAGACSSAAKQSGPTTTASVQQNTTSAKLNALLPSSVREKGSLVVATDATYPPMEYFDTDNKTIIGLDPDLAHALGQVLGVKFNFVNVTFDGVIPGLVSGRYDLSMSDIIDKKARESQVDFVTYLKASDAFLVATGNPDHITDLDSLCGNTMALQKGTNAVGVIEPQVAKCQSEGKAALTVSLFPTVAAAKEAVATKRAAAYMDDRVAMTFAAQQSPNIFQTIPGEYAAAPLGIAFSKASRELRDAVLAGLKELIANGTYNTILMKWHATDVALTVPKVNDSAY